MWFCFENRFERPGVQSLSGWLLCRSRYKAPTPALAPFHNRVDAPPAKDTSVTLEQWWTGFRDPMLVNVLWIKIWTLRLHSRGSIRLAPWLRALVRSFCPQRTSARRRPPNVQSLNGNLGTIASPVPTYRRDIHEYTIGTAASWELDVAGGLRHGAAAAREEAQAAQAEQADTRITVAADAADAYLQSAAFKPGQSSPKIRS